VGPGAGKPSGPGLDILPGNWEPGRWDIHAGRICTTCQCWETHEPNAGRCFLFLSPERGPVGVAVHGWARMPGIISAGQIDKEESEQTRDLLPNGGRDFYIPMVLHPGQGLKGRWAPCMLY